MPNFNIVFTKDRQHVAISSDICPLLLVKPITDFPAEATDEQIKEIIKSEHVKQALKFEELTSQ